MNTTHTTTKVRAKDPELQARLDEHTENCGGTSKLDAILIALAYKWEILCNKKAFQIVAGIGFAAAVLYVGHLDYMSQ